MNVTYWKNKRHQAMVVLARQVCHWTRYDGEHQLRKEVEGEGNVG